MTPSRQGPPDEDPDLAELLRKQAELLKTQGFVVHYVLDDHIPGLIDCHTHGLSQEFGFELQAVLNLRPEILIAIVSDVAKAVKTRHVHLTNGARLNGFLRGNFALGIKEVSKEGLRHMRIIIPDPSGNIEANQMAEPYAQQHAVPENS